MSFTTEVKKELLVIDELDDQSKNALLYGLLIGSSEIVITSSGMKVVLRSTLLNVLKVIIPLLRERYELNISMSYSDEVSLRKRRFYQIEILDHADEIILDYHLMPFAHLSRHDPLISTMNAKSAFLRGLFISKGSINDPRKECYHFEISSSKENVISLASKLFLERGIEVGQMERRNQYVLYVKKSEDISNCLAYIGAVSGVFYFEDQRIIRDVNNMANRMMNCDIANEVRCAKACDEQLEAIQYIRETGYFTKMTVRLQTIAMLREEYPDSSLEELSLYSENKFGKTLSKSGISHCIKDLMEYYYALKEKLKKKEDSKPNDSFEELI